MNWLVIFVNGVFGIEPYALASIAVEFEAVHRGSAPSLTFQIKKTHANRFFIASKFETDQNNLPALAQNAGYLK